MINNPPKPKIIVILGPTASGKSDLAVKIAKYISNQSRIKSRIFANDSRDIKNSRIIREPLAEIISADSRQVYRGMDIGTGKVPKDKNTRYKILDTRYSYKGIPHHLLDVASPKSTFTVSQYQKLAGKTIKEILKRGKTPIICGGTGFYIDALVYGYKLPEVPPNPKLRKELEKKSASELFKQLKKLDPARAKNIDKFNKRRLIRALEIVLTTKKPVPILSASLEGSKKEYDVLFIGIKKTQEELKKLIFKRLEKRLKPRNSARGKQSMITEVKNLHKSGVSWKKLESFGLEYRRVAEYLQGKLNKAGMSTLLQKDIEHYAKRQMTWFKRNKNINWIENYKQAEKLTDNFL